MSFDDLSDLETQTGSFPAPSMASPAFTHLTKSISHGIFTLTSNVALVHRYIGFLDTPLDTDKMRAALMDTLEKSKTLSQGLIAEIRELSRWDPEEIGATESYEQRKLLGDFQKAVTDFQFAQRLALEKQRGFVKSRRKIIEEEQAEYEPSPDGRGERIRRPKEQQTASEGNAEVALNEELIAEREHEIQGIEQGIIQMNELFRDLGVIITTQGTLLGMIPSVFCRYANHTR
jgi:syntaxin 7